MNVQLARAADGGALESAVRVFEELLPLVRPSARPAGLTRFFATRKPPDLRLRQQGRDIEREALRV